ncbi:YebC/PmpR family DNA-binding transcriptional regulator [Mesoplasma tabanidae]|uniref:Probable transcriptional regulatory protein MTABA_v1c05980 n=1 Tax=Mesoplasma tabanidae TaxID=219745 RepID=A0A2K8P6P1_9MOLU|nr:YebC/PmpR family DNA-binding transcriptional regulator [Mesoplasma tabanidae]ATZ21790.1 transcriptional regulator [Mesoplasma tabanidae]
MGRAHEVRAASMAKTAAKKSAANGRASKEIYMAAKAGGTDPSSNLALRALIDKAKSNQIPKEVIDRAVKRASGGDAENYVSNRYEGMGPGNTAIIVDALTSNVNRAAANIREVFNKNNGNPEGKVAFMFEEVSMFAFKGKTEEEILEQLMLSEVDVNDVEVEEDMVIVTAPYKSFNAVKHSLDELGIEEYLISEIKLIPTDDYIEVADSELKQQLQILLDKLDELEDVQNVYHNAAI